MEQTKALPRQTLYICVSSSQQTVCNFIYAQQLVDCVTLYMPSSQRLCDLYVFHMYILNKLCVFIYIFYSIEMCRLNMVNLPDLLLTCAKMCLQIQYFIRTYLILTWHFFFLCYISQTLLFVKFYIYRHVNRHVN